MKTLKKLILMGLAAGLCLTGCGGKESAETEGSTTEAQTEAGASTEAPASDSGEKVVYKMALLPNEGGEISEGKKGIVEEINKALEPLGASMEAYIVDDYSVVTEALVSGQSDFVTDSGATYVTARQINPDIKVLCTYAPDGDLEKAGYPSFLAVNKAHAGDFEGLTAKEDILAVFKEKSFAFVSATSTSGRVVPSTAFWDAFGPEGTKEVEDKAKIFEGTVDNGGIFSEVQFAGSHPAVVELLANDRVYGGAFCCDYGDEAVAAGDIVIVYEEQVPGDPMWYNSATIAPEHIEAIKEVLLGLTPENAAPGIFAESEDGSNEDNYLLPSERFVAVDAAYYDYIENMLADEQK